MVDSIPGIVGRRRLVEREASTVRHSVQGPPGPAPRLITNYGVMGIGFARIPMAGGQSRFPPDPEKGRVVYQTSENRPARASAEVITSRPIV